MLKLIQRLCWLPLLAASQLSFAQQHADASDPTTTRQPPSGGLLSTRYEADDSAYANPYAMSQYKTNFVLPYTYVTNPNTVGNSELTPSTVDNEEAKFQLSVKLPLYLREKTADGLYFGFTLTSFWQLYNSEVSKPFRETNYEPELYFYQRADIHFFGYEFNSYQLGFSHMSNGQSGVRSRSWNRLYGSVLFSDEDNLYYLKGWYRIPENEKVDADDPTGDDNPDITHYYGRAEFGYGTRLGDFKLIALLRNNLNLNENRGSIELNLTYPISPRYELLLQYFNGYGDSLIDYNRSQERFGIGFQLLYL